MPRRFALIIALALAFTGGSGGAAVLTRQANTTLRMPPSPPVFGYAIENAFPGLIFDDPIALAVPPGETNRLFVVEREGRIYVLTNLAAPTKTLFLDIAARVASNRGPNMEEGLSGLAFHPAYATNRQFYVFYTAYADGTAATRQDRLSRFTASLTNASSALASFEQILLSQIDESGAHNAGDLHFGPDGYLYVPLGDEGAQYDGNGNGQQIAKDFFSGILRLDVDRRPGSLPPNPHPAHLGQTNYTVPPDNPFFGITQFNGVPVDPTKVRTEFWAVGLRNPWRMSFDPVTGALFCGDVGQDAREEINRIVRGGNYGWPFREGSLNGPKANAAPVNFSALPPLAEYLHGYGTNQGNAVIGGVVYRGDRLSQLTGAYVFADYLSGNLWAIRLDGTIATAPQLLANDPFLDAFGTDPRNGDVLMCDFQSGAIKRLVYDANFTGAPLPPTLANTGAFTNLLTLAPSAGIEPYELNVPFWSDHALKRRWFSVPSTNLTIGFSPAGNWSFPTGAVWIKHFELVTNSATQQRARLETRLLVKNSNGVHGVTYRWGGSATNAVLVPEGGLDESFVVNDGGTLRTQAWHYPSRNECRACHTAVAGGPLGFHTAQLNYDFAYPGGTTNQIAALAAAGYFNAPVSNQNSLPALAAATNNAVSLEYRVRSYLAANCSQCHQPGGTGGGNWDARHTTPTSLAGLIEGPLQNDGGNPAMRVLKPGNPGLSMLHRRLLGAGAGRMPPLATSEPDLDALNLVAAWITNDLPAYQSFAAWQVQHFGATNAPAAAPGTDADGDGASNEAEYLAGTNPLATGDAWRIDLRVTNGDAEIIIPRLANRSAQVEFATNALPPLTWRLLDGPENRPFFSSTNGSVSVRDAGPTPGDRFYRVRLTAP